MKYTFLLLFALVAAGIAAQPQPYFPDQLVVTAASLNLREAPSTSGKKIASLTRGAIVSFLEAHNNGEYVQVDSVNAPWLKVRYKDKIGYVFGAHVAGAWNLYFEGEIMDAIPAGLHWYGIYQRDSFADELRPITVSLESAWNEMYDIDVQLLKTNNPQSSKFILATATPLQPGYAGPLGMYEVRDMYITDGLYPGVQIAIHAGGEPGDTLIKPSYGFAVSGCATLSNDNMYIQMENYKLVLLDYSQMPLPVQDLTPWVKPELEEINPSVSLLWFGDLDQDGRPDAILQDCPYEIGCRASLFLSSYAKPGELLRKMCEHFWPMD